MDPNPNPNLWSLNCTNRVFEQPHTILYYNMGLSSVQVTIVTYTSYTIKESGKNKTIGQFEVIGKGWNAQLGGFNFDIALTNHLADTFNSMWMKKKSYDGHSRIQDHIRPMTRLREQASKIKEVLSANPEFPIKVEQLHADLDLQTKVTRKQFEDMCADLFAEITKVRLKLRLRALFIALCCYSLTMTVMMMMTTIIIMMMNILTSTSVLLCLFLFIYSPPPISFSFLHYAHYTLTIIIPSPIS